MGKTIKTEVEIKKIKVYDPFKKRHVWEWREIHTFYDPYKKKVRSIDAETLKDIEGD